jgi:hypothetical protein
MVRSMAALGVGCLRGSRHAQLVTTSFADLQTLVRPGDTVVEADMTRMRQARRDSVWNGTLIGLGVGAGLGGAFAGTVSCDGCDSGFRTGAFLSFAGIGAAIGYLIDGAR